MFEDVRKNKIKTGFIISTFILIITLILYYLCMAFDLDAFTSILFALFFSIISCWASYYNSDKIILAVSNAKPATEEENKKIMNILDGLMISSGLSHKPKLYVIEDSQPNAFATGRNPEHAIICVTTGLLDKLNYYELEGVIAHEMAHIKNYDILLSAVVTVMVGFIVMLSDFFTRGFLYRSNRSKDNDNNGSAILMFIGLIFLILAPIISKIMQMAVSRRREFLADSTAVEFTRNPEGLISALRKLDDDPNELKSVSKATENMYIVNPFKKQSNGKKKANIFSTHPSIEDRIDALKNIK